MQVEGWNKKKKKKRRVLKNPQLITLEFGICNHVLWLPLIINMHELLIVHSCVNALHKNKSVHAYASEGFRAFKLQVRQAPYVQVWTLRTLWICDPLRIMWIWTFVIQVPLMTSFYTLWSVGVTGFYTPWFVGVNFVFGRALCPTLILTLLNSVHCIMELHVCNAFDNMWSITFHFMSYTFWYVICCGTNYGFELPSTELLSSLVSPFLILHVTQVSRVIL